MRKDLFFVVCWVAGCSSSQSSIDQRRVAVSASIAPWSTNIDSATTDISVQLTYGQGTVLAVDRSMVEFVAKNASLTTPDRKTHSLNVISVDDSQPRDGTQATALEPAEIILDGSVVTGSGWNSLNLVFPESMAWEGFMKTSAKAFFRLDSAPAVIKVSVVDGFEFDVNFSEAVTAASREEPFVVADSAGHTIACSTAWDQNASAVYFAAIRCDTGLPSMFRVTLKDGVFFADGKPVRSTTGENFDLILTPAELPVSSVNERIWEPASPL